MSASSSLSRLELVLNSNPANSGSSATSTVASSFTAITNALPSWIPSSSSSSSSSSSLPLPAGSSNSSSSLNTAAANAQAAATKAANATSHWFHTIAAKVQGKEPPATTAAPSTNSSFDVESGSTGGAGGGDASNLGLLAEPTSSGPTSGLMTQFSNELSALTSLSWKQRMIAFVMSAAIGCVMLFLALSFLPLVFVGSSVKFALSYALGNFFLLASSCFLVGPTKQLAQMFTPERALSSGLYIGSLLLTFYVSWAWRSFFIVVPVLTISFASLAFYVMSYIPFGQNVLKKICAWTIGRQFNFSS